MRTILLVFFLLGATISRGQTKEVVVGNFNKLILSPGIDLILTEGNQPSVNFEFTSVDSRKINATVNNNTLSIYLEDARMIPKRKKVRKHGYDYHMDMYQHAKITAYVTFTDLKKLEVRGDNEVTCVTEIRSPKLKVVQYGDNRVEFNRLNTIKFKSVAYGENELEVKSGQSSTQVFKSFGENKIETRHFESQLVRSKIYGTSEMSVNATQKLAVTSFGEGEIRNSGRGYIKRKIIIGETSTGRISNLR